MMHQIDIQQPLRQVSGVRSASLLYKDMSVVSSNRSRIGTATRNNPRRYLLRDEHIAEARAVTMQETRRRQPCNPGASRQDVIHVPQVTQMQFWRVLVNLNGGSVALDNLRRSPQRVVTTSAWQSPFDGSSSAHTA